MLFRSLIETQSTAVSSYMRLHVALRVFLYFPFLMIVTGVSVQHAALLPVSFHGATRPSSLQLTSAFNRTHGRLTVLDPCFGLNNTNLTAVGSVYQSGLHTTAYDDWDWHTGLLAGDVPTQYSGSTLPAPTT